MVLVAKEPCNTNTIKKKPHFVTLLKSIQYLRREHNIANNQKTTRQIRLPEVEPSGFKAYKHIPRFLNESIITNFMYLKSINFVTQIIDRHFSIHLTYQDEQLNWGKRASADSFDI
jgi:hypothetical protein